MTKSRVIIALDFKNKADVLEFLDKFDEPLFVKVGMELFYGEGPAIIQAIKERGHSRKFDSCLQFFTNQIAQNVDYINAFEFFYCQIRENKCTNMG